MKTKLLSLIFISLLGADEPPFPTATSQEPSPYSRAEVEEERNKQEESRQRRSEEIIDKAQNHYNQRDDGDTTPTKVTESTKVTKETKPTKNVSNLVVTKSEHNTTFTPKRIPITLDVNVPDATEEESYDESSSSVNTKVSHATLTVEIENNRDGNVALESVNRCKTPYPTHFIIVKEGRQ